MNTKKNLFLSFLAMIYGCFVILFVMYFCTPACVNSSSSSKTTQSPDRIYDITTLPESEYVNYLVIKLPTVKDAISKCVYYSALNDIEKSTITQLFKANELQIYSISLEYFSLNKSKFNDIVNNKNTCISASSNTLWCYVMWFDDMANLPKNG